MLVRRWLDRPENRAEWERLRGALSLSEGFQFFALQVNDPIAELFLEMLLKAEAGDDGADLVGFDLARPPEKGPTVTVLLQAMEAAPRPAWFFFQGSSMFRDGAPAPGDLFLYLNQKRDTLAQVAVAPFLLSLPPEGWTIFRQAAPDFWSIHTSVYRFGGAEVRREERVRWASEEAFLWKAFAQFAALRFLRAVLPSRLPRTQAGDAPPPPGERLVGRESEARTLRTWLAQPGSRISVPAVSGKAALLRDVWADAQRIHPGGVFYFSLEDGGGAVRIMEEVVETLRPGLVVPLLRRNVLRAMFRDVTAEKKILLVLDDANDLDALEELTPSPPSTVLAVGRVSPEDWRRLAVRVPRALENSEPIREEAPPTRCLSEGGAATRLEIVSEAAREKGDLALAAETLGWAALGFVHEGDLDGAKERFTAARALAQESGRADLEAFILRHQTAFLLWTGQIDVTTELAQALRLNPAGWIRGDLSILTVLALDLAREFGDLQAEQLKTLAVGPQFSISRILRGLVATEARKRLSLGDSAEILRRLEVVLDTKSDPNRDLGVRSWLLALRGELQLRNKDSVAAQESAEAALSHARAVYDLEAEAEALRVLGQILEDTGDFSGAESARRRLLAIREELCSPDNEGVAWAALNLARLLSTIGNLEEADTFFLRSIAILQKGRPGTDQALSFAMYERGNLLGDKGRFSEAEATLREALAVSSLGPAHPFSVGILGLLGSLAMETGRWGEAEELLRSTLSIYEHSQESQSPVGRRIMASNLSLLADALVKSGQVAEAMEVLLDRQLPLVVELGDLHRHAVTLRQIGVLLASQEQYDKALLRFQERLSLFDELGDIRGRALALGEIATILVAQDRHDEALPLFQEQLAIFERLDDATAAEVVRKVLQTYEPDPL